MLGSVRDMWPREGDARRVGDLSFAALALATATAITLCVVEFSRKGSLFHDEACLALNFVLRWPADLFKPLSFDQAAAPGYLLMEHFVSTMFGSSEAVLRLPTLICACAAIVLFAMVGRRLFNAWVAAIAVSILAVSPLFIEYASFVKPYCQDTMLALWILLCVVRVADRPSRGNRTLLMVSGIAGIFFSQTLILVLIAMGILLALREWRSDRPIQWILLCLVVWGATFLPLYFAIYRIEGQSPFMQGYWVKDILAVFRPHLLERAHRIGRNVLVDSVDSLSPLILGKGVFLLAAAGVFFCARKKGPFWTFLLISPYLLLLAISAAGAYPVAPRVTLFAIPMLILLIAAGIGYGGAFLLRNSLLRVAALGSLIVFLAYGIRSYIKTPPRREEREISGSLIQQYRTKTARCAPIYVLASGLPVWTFYTKDIPQTPVPMIETAVAENLDEVFEGKRTVRDPNERYQIGCRTVLLGNMAPSYIKSMETDQEWADGEFIRLLRLKSPQVYIFHDLYSERGLIALLHAALRYSATVIKLGGQEDGNYLGVIEFGQPQRGHAENSSLH